MAAYYNEIDRKTAAWLRELIKAGLIADGEVDERSITDVEPADLTGFTQCHFFAGIGGWSYALRLAGWGDGRPVWTGSCPCQPFSAAGKGDGADDSRHLWPTWFRLIRECRPVVCFGEQVASADGLGWLDRVSTDLEAENYAIAAVDLGAPGVGGFHIRQRLWFVADAERPAGRSIVEHRTDDLKEVKERAEGSGGPRERGSIGALDNPERERTERVAGGEGREECAPSSGRQDEGRWQLQVINPSATGDVGHSEGEGFQGERREPRTAIRYERGRFIGLPGVSWADADWLPCVDGKARPVEPGTFPLAHGIPARVGRLRGYGNAIVPQVAAEVIRAYMEIAA
mgnify:CR=1 FL=1